MGDRMMEDDSNKKRPLVLVADDNKVIRHLVRKALEMSGFSVEEAADGEEMLATFERLNPDIIILVFQNKIKKFTKRRYRFK